RRVFEIGEYLNVLEAAADGRRRRGRSWLLRRGRLREEDGNEKRGGRADHHARRLSECRARSIARVFAVRVGRLTARGIRRSQYREATRALAVPAVRPGLVADLQVPSHRVGDVEALEISGHVGTRLA